MRKEMKIIGLLDCVKLFKSWDFINNFPFVARGIQYYVSCCFITEKNII